MTQATTETPLDEAVTSAVADGLAAVTGLEEHIARALDDCLTAARKASVDHGSRAGCEVIETLERELHSARAEAAARFLRQRERLQTFNLVLFGRTGAGKSSLIEALSSGDGLPISQGESDWTTDVRDVRWRSCRLFDTPGISGWGRTVARAELEARAERAVEDADIVVLCFDTQSQQAGEFRKVADWVAQYGKPVVALLNARNARWRFNTRVPRESARRSLSRSVHEHAGNIRDELARVGLPDVPVVAVHTKRAAFARTRDPYHGPDATSRTRLREEFGAERLLEWSNLPALETLLAAALRDHATTLRLGMLNEQTRGVLDALRIRTSGERTAARAAIEQIERSVADVLTVLGRPRERKLAQRLERLETLRAGGFDVAAEGEAEGHARRRLAAALGKPRRAALLRADEFVDSGFKDGQDLNEDGFRSEVLEPGRADVERAVQKVQREFLGYLEKRLGLITDDFSADLAATAATFAGAKGSAGRGTRTAGLGFEVSGIAMGMASAVMLIAAGSNPVGWAIVAAGLATKLLGRRLRRNAAQAREQARSTARAVVRKSVNDTFDTIEAHICDEIARAVSDGLAERLADEVDRASALRRAVALAEQTVGRVTRAIREVSPPADVAHLLADVARELQRETFPGVPSADRLLWLGEAWCDDPDGIEESLTEAAAGDTTGREPRRGPHVLDRLLGFTSARRERPAVGDGRAWLELSRTRLVGDDDAVSVLNEMAAALERRRPRLVVAGDYSAGKSSFIKRLLVESGAAVPDELDISAQPRTERVSHFDWGGWELVDTPGFQSSMQDHAPEAHRALVGASVVLVLFNPNLVVGDVEDLSSVLLGDPSRGRVGKLARTVFIINRADELGVDPHDDLDTYERLCERKELELTQALAAITGAAPDVVVCVASDPFGMVGDRRDVTAADYAQHRDWDGIEPLRHVFLEANGDLLQRGLDVMVLEGGAAKLGALAARRRDELASAIQQLEQHRRLQLDLDACLAAGEALKTAARDRLDATFVGFVADLYDEVEATADPAQRHARIQRLERWSEDEELQQLFAEWAAGTERELDEWKKTTADYIERRVHTAAFVTAFPVLDDAFDLGHLGPAKGDDVKRSVRQAGKHAAERASQVSGERVMAVAHRFGHKFRPWGATKLTAKVRVAGGAIGLAIGAWESYDLWKSLGREKDAEERAAQARSRLLRDVRRAAIEFFASYVGPGPVLVAEIEPVAAMHAEVAGRVTASESAVRALSDTIGRNEACIADALERV